jgi:hypothetical protein
MVEEEELLTGGTFLRLETITAGEFLPLETITAGLFTEVDEFACHDASCRPPTSGGSGGSKPGGGASGDFKRSPSEHLDLLFPGRRESASGGKTQYADGTMSVEGLTESGDFKTYKPATEKKNQETWDAIGPKHEQYVANLKVAGELAMGIDPKTGKVDPVQAAKGHQDSKWYTVAHSDCQAITHDTGIPLDSVIAATTTLSAGRLWSGTKNGNIETARALADIVKNPIEIEVSQKHLDMMAWRAGKSTKGVGKIGLDTSNLKPGKISSKDLDSATLVELMYASNTLRGHETFNDWVEKSTKDGKVGFKTTREQLKNPPPYPYFTSKGTQQVKQAVAVLRGEVTPRQAISGPKYSSFFSNIRNPYKDYSSTNDTWHYRVMAGNLKLSASVGKAGKNGEVGDRVTRTRNIVEHSIKEHSPDGKITTTQDIFQKAGSSKAEGLGSGDIMFRDTTKITRTALDQLKQQYPTQFGDMKMHEFQALIWVHYGGGQVSDEGRTKAWFGALDTMKSLGL